MEFLWNGDSMTREDKEQLPANIPTHIAEEIEKRYVANQDTIGSIPVTTRATTQDIAQPR